MRISDWSSDVCSSDLRPGKPGGIPCGAGSAPGIWQVCRQCMADAFDLGISFVEPAQVLVDRLVAEKRIQPFENCQGNRNLFRREINLRRSEEHTSELQSLMRISYAVFCLKKKK